MGGSIRYDPGKWAVKQVKPYVNYAKVLTGPVLMSASVAMGAGTSYRGSVPRLVMYFTLCDELLDLLLVSAQYDWLHVVPWQECQRWRVQHWGNRGSSSR